MDGPPGLRRRPRLVTLLRRATALLAVTAGVALSSASASGSAALPVLVIEGRGNGHGVGMSQDGALAMGRAGDDTATILDKFYPGTRPSTAGGPLGVRVYESDATELEVVFPRGGEVRASPSEPQPPGFPIPVEAGESVAVSLGGGRFRADVRGRGRGESAMPALQLVADEPDPPPLTSEQGVSTTTTTAFSSTTTSATMETDPDPAPVAPVGPESGGGSLPEPDPTPAPAPTMPEPPPAEESSAAGLVLVPAEGSTTVLPARQRSYRGVMEVGTSALGGLLLVNRLDVEDYLKGMGEVLDPTWPAAALEAQAIAARTYALRATRTGGTICDDDRCQVYLGAEVEYPAMNQAVDGTAGRVLTFDGGLASTVYSASAGGVTALPSEGFGTDSSDYPYLVSTPYLTKDPVRWTQSIPLADLGTRFGYRGEVTDATVSAAGPSGRALEVTIAGDSGPMVVPVLTFASRLDLQSTLFSLRPGEGAVRRSPVPQVPRPVQAQPDEVATLRPLAILPEPARHTPDKVRVSCALLAVAVAAAHESRRRQRARASARSTGI